MAPRSLVAPAPVARAPPPLVAFGREVLAALVVFSVLGAALPALLFFSSAMSISISQDRSHPATPHGPETDSSTLRFGNALPTQPRDALTTAIRHRPNAHTNPALRSGVVEQHMRQVDGGFSLEDSVLV